MAKARRMSAVDRTGHRYGRLVVVGREPNHFEPNGNAKTMWLCRCDCGNTAVVQGAGLQKGAAGKGGTQSCGCLNRENAPKHGLSEAPIYRVWHGMVQRCTNPALSTWRTYGGRGIGVCDKWRTFAGFYEDMGARPKGGTLERIDNERGYEPGNCRWATRLEQANNRRTNVFLEHKGERRTMAEWCRVVGIGQQALRNRLGSGWSVDRALTTPVAPRTHRKEDQTT